MRKLPGIIVLILLLFLLVSSSSQANATSGPVGLNFLRTESGPDTGTVTLNWQRYWSDVSGYSIVYGTQPGKYQYGAANIGNIATYTVRSLTPGVRYYFQLWPYRNGAQVISTSPEVSEIAATGPTTVIGTQGPYGQRLLTATKDGKGSVALKWISLGREVSSFNVMYGLQPGKYIYSALNIGKVYSYTINSLTSGTRYYFALTSITGDVTGVDTAEVSQVAP